MATGTSLHIGLNKVDPDGYGWGPQGGELVSWLQAYGLSQEYSVPVNWDQIADLVEDAYRRVAPPKLVAGLDSRER